MTEHKIVVSENIYLDIIQQGDAKRLVELANNPEMRMNIADTFPYPYTQECADWWIKNSQEVISSDKVSEYGIYIDGEYAGNMGWDVREGGRKSHNYRFGYWLGKPYRGKGYMTKIVSVFCNHMFKNIENCHRIYAAVYSRNPASCRVLEKNDFRQEAIHKEAICWDGKYYDEIVYAKLRK